MGILDNVSAKFKGGSKITTGNMYFGNPEAESENLKGQGIVDYFSDYLNVLRELNMGKFIFVGRKGTGKSAIAKYIKDKSDVESESYACIIRMSDIEIEKIVQIGDKKNEYALIEWLILLNLTKLIVKSGTAQYTKEYSKLQKFLENNTGSVEVDQYQMIERIKDRKGTVNFEVLRHCFGGIIERNFQSKEQSAPYYKMIVPLKEILRWLFYTEDAQNREYWVLIDDLDVGYKLDCESDNDKLMDLIRIVRQFNTELLSEKSKILVFIREDICNHIVSKYNDSAKIIQSNNIPINWYIPLSSGSNVNEIPLKKLADRRIYLAFEKNGISIPSDKSPWECLINETSFNNSSFKSILDFTFYRPRDIITFLDAVRIINCPIPLSSYNVKNALKKYITLSINEIKSELSLYFSEKEKSILFEDIFPYIVTNNINYPTFLEYISHKDFNKSNEDVSKILSEYALIGWQKKSKCYYNFREHSLPENLDINKCRVIVPLCIYYHYKNLPDDLNNC